jgi:mannose/cellobiose epimerase-like protein (N-acyl-D-glucosamine 2-epimerase family)
MPRNNLDLHPARTKEQAASAFDRLLRERVMPYWYRTTLDKTFGGYRLADKHQTWWTLARGAKNRFLLLFQKKFPPLPFTTTEKHIVAQCRMIWGFSHAHRIGYSNAKYPYLHAGELG